MTCPKEDRHWLRQLAEEYFRMIELAAIVLAFLAFGLESCNRQEERKARAWQLLTTKASGNSGKVWALNFLNDKGVSLRGIDLTPPGLAEYWSSKSKGKRNLSVKGCPDRVDLHDVKLRYAMMEEASLVCADLHYADLKGANFRETDLRGAYLQEADLKGADLKGADLEKADLRKAKGIGCAQLEQADNWQASYRDEALACGGEIPDPEEKAH